MMLKNRSFPTEAIETLYYKEHMLYEDEYYYMLFPRKIKDSSTKLCYFVRDKTKEVFSFEYCQDCSNRFGADRNGYVTCQYVGDFCKILESALEKGSKAILVLMRAQIEQLLSEGFVVVNGVGIHLESCTRAPSLRQGLCSKKVTVSTTADYRFKRLGFIWPEQLIFKQEPAEFFVLEDAANVH